MKDLKEEYKNLINALSEKNFKFVVKNYLMEYWKTEEVNITDGPWDGGNDASIYINGIEKKRNIQITIQDNFVKKLFQDVSKSKANVDKYSYLNKLDFFISKSISNSQRDELIQKAEVEYDISLRIFDSNKLADDLNRFEKTRHIIHDIYASNTLRKTLNINKKNKILYDVLSTGNNITQIKFDFIVSHIQLYLFDNPNTSINDLRKNINKSLDLNLNNNSITSLIKKQISNGFIDYSNDTYNLTKLAIKNIQEIKTISTSQENLLIDEIGNCLQKYNLKNVTTEIIEKIILLYNANYEAEIEEINSTADTFKPKEWKIFSELRRFIKNKGVSEEQLSSLMEEVLSICEKNEYLNKISVTNLFTSLFQNNKLEDYLNQFNRNIFLDTQVLLQAVCFNYKNSSDYSDSLYTSVKYLMEHTEKLSGKIRLFTSSNYVEEVAGHLWEANKIKELMELPFIEALGPSKNIFINFYNHIQNEEGKPFYDFDEFVYEFFDIEIDSINKNNFVNEVYNQIADLIESIDIEIIEIPFFDNYQAYKREYEIELSYLGSKKNYKARDNDLKMLLYLSTDDFHINEESGLFDEPFFVTWDSSFYPIRKRFMKKFIKDFSYWYLYTPSKLANRLAVMNLKLNTKILNYNLISLTETNFNLMNESVSFIDTLSSFFNKGDINKWQLGKKLASFRKSQVEDSNLSNFTKKHHNNQPIDEILKSIHEHYNNPTTSNSFTSIVELFENDTNSEQIAELILMSCNKIIERKDYKKILFKELDEKLNKNSNDC